MMKRLLAAAFWAVASIACAQTMPQMPYAFANQSGNVPAAELDNNFNYLLGTSQTFVPASLYGVSTSNSDNGPAFNAALAAGKVVTLAPGVYPVKTTISTGISQTGIICQSGGYGVSNVGPSNAHGCWLQWNGASGGTIMSIIAPAGTTSNGGLYGNIVQGINFDGDNGLAANGLVIQSERFGTFSSLYFQNFSGGIDLDVNVTNYLASQFGDFCDTQYNDFRNIDFYQYSYSSVSLRVGDYNNPAGPNGGCNASLNSFYNISMGFSTGTAIWIDGGDNNMFYNISGFRVSGGTAPMVDFSIHVQDGGQYPANGNVFYRLSSNAPWIARGQTSFPGCVAYAGTPGVSNICTFNNVVYGTDQGNNTPAPTVEPGANLNYLTSQGVFTGFSGNHFAVGDSPANAIASQQRMGSDSLHVYNANDNHIVLDDGTNSWGINIDTTGALRLSHGAGATDQLNVIGYVDAANGYVGVTTGAAAFAGTVGEYQSNTTSGTSLTNNVVSNCTSKSLPAGGWMVQSVVTYTQSSPGLITGYQTGVSTTSATLGAFGSYTGEVANQVNGLNVTTMSPMVSLNISSPTTVYALGDAGFSSGTVTCNGVIQAWRVH